MNKYTSILRPLLGLPGRRVFGRSGRGMGGEYAGDVVHQGNPAVAGWPWRTRGDRAGCWRRIRSCWSRD